MNDNLPELRDIHLPEGVSAFPPAYGWFVLLACALALWAGWKLFKLWQVKSRRHYALKILASLNPEQSLESAVKISELLRRICVYRYPEAVALSGGAWIRFLQRRSRHRLDSETAELLKNAPYLNPKHNKISPQSLQKLKTFAQNWVGENL